MTQNKQEDDYGKYSWRGSSHNMRTVDLYSWWINFQKPNDDWIQLRKSLDARDELSAMQVETLPCTKLEEEESSAVNDVEEDFKPDYAEWLKRKEWNKEQTAALFAGIDPDQLDTVKKMAARYTKYMENLSTIGPIRVFNASRRTLPPYKIVPWARRHLTDIPEELKEIDNVI
jgi:hypothetical protein